jgi:hypothetical protein
MAEAVKEKGWHDVIERCSPGKPACVHGSFYWLETAQMHQMPVAAIKAHLLTLWLFISHFLSA